MRLVSSFVAFLTFLCTFGLSPVQAEVVELDGFKSKTPNSWKSIPLPAKSLRYKQFQIPAVKGDRTDAEVVIFKGLGGGVEPNVNRWKSQFTPPAGKNREDATTVTKIKIGGREATYVDIQGTYNPPQFDPTFGKVKNWPEFRLLAVYFQGPDDVYQIKLTGPMDTVTQQKKAFDAWLSDFKK